jgi:hypothetical protein
MDRNSSLWLPAVIIGVLLFSLCIIAVPIIWDKHRKTGKAFLIMGSFGLVLILISLGQNIWWTFSFVLNPSRDFSGPQLNPFFRFVISFGWLSLLIIGMSGIAAAWEHRILKAFFMVILVAGLIIFLGYIFLITLAGQIY